MTGVRKRRYDNSGRRVQAARTRRRILDATVELVGRPGGALVLRDVARLAGVALPTIHKHFRTRAALLAAVKERVDQTPARTPARTPAPRTLAEFRTSVPELHAFFRAREGIIRAVVHNPDVAPLRAAAFRARDAGIERVLAPVTTHLSKAEVATLRALFVRVMAAPAWLELRDEHRLPDEAITRMTGWAVETLVDRLEADARRLRRRGKRGMLAER